MKGRMRSMAGRKKAGKYSRTWLEGIESGKSISQLHFEHFSGIEHIYVG